MSSRLITEIKHAYAIAAEDIVKAAAFVATKALPALVKVKSEEATVEAITGLVDPQAANIERVGFALVGLAIQTIDDAAAAAVQAGLLPITTGSSAW